MDDKKSSIYCSPSRYDAIYRSQSNKISQCDDIVWLNDLKKQYNLTFVLDAGCGTGRLSLAMAALGIEVIGVDISKAMIEEAQKISQAKEYRVDRYLNLKWILADIRDMDLGLEFDAIVFGNNSIACLASKNELENFLVVSKRHLKPGGHLFVDALNFHQKRLYNNDKLMRICEYCDPVDWENTTLFELSSFSQDELGWVEQIRWFHMSLDHEIFLENTFAHRYWDHEVLVGKLRESGFKIDNLYGYYDRIDYEALSPLQLIIASV